MIQPLGPSKIVTGLHDPRDIAIDFKMSRIYWADRVADKIQSSNLDGSGVLTVADVAPAAAPTGIALIGAAVFWEPLITTSYAAATGKERTSVSSTLTRIT